MSEELPNIGLLIKLLKMTSSSNDGEALSAMRKANEQLAKFGGDWEALLRGKVTIIGDPFANITPPPSQPRAAAPAPPPRPAPRRWPQPRKPYAPPPPPPPTPKPNRFPGMTPLYGNTYPVKDQLKTLGAAWDATNRVWMIPDAQMAAAKAILSGVPPATKHSRQGPADVNDLLNF